jgi:hypothetical protein
VFRCSSHLLFETLSYAQYGRRSATESSYKVSLIFRINTTILIYQEMRLELQYQISWKFCFAVLGILHAERWVADIAQLICSHLQLLIAHAPKAVYYERLLLYLYRVLHE